MTDFSLKLSAYLDGELNSAGAAEVDAILDRDPAIQAEFASLIQADILAQETFDAELDLPVPFTLVHQIKNTTLELQGLQALPTSRPIWGSIAAGLVVFALGGAGGYFYKDQTTPTLQKPGWIAAIADYHGVYAGQARHLVEVGAEESDHIEAWLGKTVGTEFSIPDLTQHGLTFKGGRLVVANGKPVAQLMYTQDDGAVVALCLQKSNKDPTSVPIFDNKTVNAFDVVSWSANGADYVVIGPEGLQNLPDIAASAAQNI